MAALLQVVGLIVLSIGVVVWFGPGPGLVAAGASSAVLGVAIERDKGKT